MLTQFESDLAKSRQEEEGLRELMRQTEKAFQQQRIVQTQRMKTIRKLHEQYMKVHVCGDVGCATAKEHLTHNASSIHLHVVVL